MDVLLAAKRHMDTCLNELKNAKAQLKTAETSFLLHHKTNMHNVGIESIPRSTCIEIDQQQHGCTYGSLIWKPEVNKKKSINRSNLKDALLQYLCSRNIPADEAEVESTNMSSYVWRARKNTIVHNVIEYKPTHKRKRSTSNNRHTKKNKTS